LVIEGASPALMTDPVTITESAGAADGAGAEDGAGADEGGAGGGGGGGGAGGGGTRAATIRSPPGARNSRSSASELKPGSVAPPPFCTVAHPGATAAARQAVTIMAASARRISLTSGPVIPAPSA